ncbi:MAG TPA: hypothetical protein VK081_14055, partial [Planctomycetota bacterium]|nr:hypothetical protein [Planctomycetota bacterium]
MQLETIASPVSVDAPHQRYAALHRAVERGMATDATWRELAEVCLRLKHHDEARSACEKIKDAHLRRDVEHMLQRRGLLPREDGGPVAVEIDEPGPRSIREDALDALRILFEDHMPVTTVVTTLTFPVVVGLGGFLTSATNNSFLFPAIAALPALCVAAVVGGMSRRIFLDAAQGLEDAPKIPELRELCRQSIRFLRDALVIGLVLLGPAVVLGLVQGLMVSTLLAAALGAFLLPGALAIKQLSPDWRALSPNCLFPAIARLRTDYAATAGLCTLVALPAALAAVLTTGSHLYLQASVVGPLAVAPLFFAARLVGLMVYGNRHELRDLLTDGTPLAASKAPSARTLRNAAPPPRPARRAESSRPTPVRAPLGSRTTPLASRTTPVGSRP